MRAVDIIPVHLHIAGADNFGDPIDKCLKCLPGLVYPLSVFRAQEMANVIIALALRIS